MRKEPLKKLLLVDDDAEILEILLAFFSSKPYEIKTARTGGEALREILNDLPDLILLDVDMPGLNGLSTLRAIRENTRTAKIPVILATALGTENIVKSAFDAGVDGFLVKPYNLPDLDQRIQERILFSDFESVRRLAAEIDPSQKTKKHLNLPELSMELWDVYPTRSRRVEVFLCTPKGEEPQALALSKDAKEESFVVFAKLGKKWRRVWPRLKHENQKAA